MQPATWFALAGYGMLPVALWLHQRGRDRWSLAALVLCAALLRLGPSLDPGLHPWDERYHALVAKNLAEDPLEPTLYADPLLPHDDANWTVAHIWLHKPPFAMWCMALSIKILGPHVLAVRLPSILFACLAVVLSHSLAKSLVSLRVAFWSALLFAINGHLIELASGRTSTDHVDAILVALILAGAYAGVRMAQQRSFFWACISGACMGLAFLTKTWPALLVCPIVFVALLSYSASTPAHSMALFGAVVLTALVIVLPWQLHVHATFPTSMLRASAATFDHFQQDIETHARPWYYYLAQIPMMHGELAPLAILWSIVMIIRKRSRPPLLLLAWVIVPFIVFSFARSKMPAYTAIAAPAVFMLIAMVLSDWWSVKKSLAQWLALPAAFLLVLLPLRFSWDRVKPFAAVTATWNTPAHLVHAPPRTVVLHCPDPIELMFRTPVAAAYTGGMDAHTREDLEAQGYRFVPFQSDPPQR